MQIESGYVEGLHRAFNAFREENDKGRPSLETLARIETELLRHETKQREMGLRGQRRGPGEMLGKSTPEQKAAFFTWARFGSTEIGNEWPGGAEGAKAGWEQERKRARLQFDRKALTVSDDTTGGYLAPDEFVAELIKAAVLLSPMRDLVRVRTTTGRTADIPKRTGTAAAVWVGETATRAETQNPSYGMVPVTPAEMTAVVDVSFANLEDSGFDMEAELQEEFGEQFAVTEGKAVVGGNGIGKPIGFTDPSQALASTNSGSAATIADVNGQADGIVDCAHQLKSAYAANATWTLNRTTLGSVRKLKDAQKQYLWQPSPALGMPNTILGYPYLDVPDMDSEGAGKFPMALGDWRRGYTIVDRIKFSMTRDPFTQSSRGLVRFTGRRRVGGQVVLGEAIRLLKCSI